jgi:pimeloyl-ACP methyl ester carboxylesterase
MPTKSEKQARRYPIVILHGWAIDQQNDLKWQPFMEFLKEAGWKVHFLPLPGLSSPLEKVWQLNDYVNWVREQIRGEEQVILMGHSFGGQLAVH